MKIKFGNSVVARNRKQPKNQLFHKGDFKFYINGSKCMSVTYRDMTRKAAINKAIRDMPGCTFSVEKIT